VVPPDRPLPAVAPHAVPRSLRPRAPRQAASPRRSSRPPRPRSRPCPRRQRRPWPQPRPPSRPWPRPRWRSAPRLPRRPRRPRPRPRLRWRCRHLWGPWPWARRRSWRRSRAFQRRQSPVWRLLCRPARPWRVSRGQRSHRRRSCLVSLRLARRPFPLAPGRWPPQGWRRLAWQARTVDRRRVAARALAAEPVRPRAWPAGARAGWPPARHGALGRPSRRARRQPSAAPSPLWIRRPCRARAGPARVERTPPVGSSLPRPAARGWPRRAWTPPAARSAGAPARRRLQRAWRWARSGGRLRGRAARPSFGRVPTQGSGTSRSSPPLPLAPRGRAAAAKLEGMGWSRRGWPAGSASGPEGAPAAPVTAAWPSPPRFSPPALVPAGRACPEDRAGASHPAPGRPVGRWTLGYWAGRAVPEGWRARWRSAAPRSIPRRPAPEYPARPRHLREGRLLVRRPHHPGRPRRRGEGHQAPRGHHPARPRRWDEGHPQARRAPEYPGRPWAEGGRGVRGGARRCGSREAWVRGWVAGGRGVSRSGQRAPAAAPVAPRAPRTDPRAIRGPATRTRLARDWHATWGLEGASCPAAR
jgi:hypothetical protein